MRILYRLSFQCHWAEKHRDSRFALRMSEVVRQDCGGDGQILRCPVQSDVAHMDLLSHCHTLHRFRILGGMKIAKSRQPTQQCCRKLQTRERSGHWRICRWLTVKLSSFGTTPCKVIVTMTWSRESWTANEGRKSVDVGETSPPVTESRGMLCNRCLKYNHFQQSRVHCKCMFFT